MQSHSDSTRHRERQQTIKHPHPASLHPGGSSSSHGGNTGQNLGKASNNELFLEKPNLSSHPSVLKAGHKKKSIQPSRNASYDELFLEELNLSSGPRSSFEETLFSDKSISEPLSRGPKLSLNTSIPRNPVKRSTPRQSSLPRLKHAGVKMTDKPSSKQKTSKKSVPPSSPEESPLPSSELQEWPPFKTPPKPHYKAANDLFEHSLKLGAEVSPLTSPISPGVVYAGQPPPPKKSGRPSSSHSTQSRPHSLHSTQPKQSNESIHHEPQKNSKLPDESRWVNTRSTSPSLQHESGSQHAGAKKGILGKAFGGRKDKS